MTDRGVLLIRKLTADFTARWWAVFSVVIVLPSLGLSIVSLRLIDRLAKDEVANLVRASEAVPWYYEEKMNRALEARALHAARIVGYETLQDPAATQARLEAAHLALFESLTIDKSGRAASSGVLMASARGAALPLDDDEGRSLGTLRYSYSKEGLRTVLKQSLNDRSAPWNDDAIEFFVGGPVAGRFRQDFDLHLTVRALDPVLWERQGRTQDIRFASDRTEDGFAIEIAIPWRHVGVRPEPDAALRFDLTNDDDDGGGLRDGQRNWSGHDRNWVDPSKFGVLRLAAAPGRASGKEAEALPAVHPIAIDGRLTESDWSLTNDAPEVGGRTDNLVRWGALWTPEELLVAVRVVDPKVVNDQSHEDVDWVLRIVDPDGEVLLDSSPQAETVLSQSGGIDLRQMISLGALRGSHILFAFQDRPITKRILRWKLSAAGLIVGMDLLLGFGLWLVYTNVKRQMDLAALKSHFVATVSHEFKAPLALLQASAETLRGGRVQEPEKRKRYESIIESESRRLAALVDNVLSVSRIEAGRPYQFKHTEVPAVVDAALSLHKLRLEQEGFEVDVAVARDLPAVVADAAALQEALSNLLDNAIKYSREIKRCRIEARVAGDGIEISVADGGLGVPLADKDKIFERFYRGEREGHGEKGVGLGLSIARDILKAHGGDVRVENAPGGGSIFTLVLPGEGTGGMSTILVIEDDPNLAFVLKDNLEFEGYTVVTVADGTQGLEKVAVLRPDLVILDVMLPGLNGIQVCKGMRERGDRTPVILLTARSQEAEKVQGLDAGADDYVTKPFGVQELLARVRVILRRSHPQDRLDRYAFAHVEVDFKSFRATRAGKKLPLSQREIELLRFLIERKGEPVSRATLLREVWSAKEPPSARAVDVHVTHLRNKLGPAAARHIVTVHGVGYTFVEA